MSKNMRLGEGGQKYEAGSKTALQWQIYTHEGPHYSSGRLQIQWPTATCPLLPPRPADHSLFCLKVLTIPPIVLLKRALLRWINARSIGGMMTREGKSTEEKPVPVLHRSP